MMQAATRNTRSSASVNASMNVACRRGRKPIERRRVERADTGRRSLARERMSSSRLVKIAPRIAVPTEPPIERNSVAPEVATPSSSYGDRVLHGEHEHLHHHAEPEAEHEHVDRGAAAVLVPASIVRQQRTCPTHATAVPAIGHAL